MKFLVIGIVSLLLSTPSLAQLEVITSGGFQGPYDRLLPEFEKNTGIQVITKSGASQGSGPNTIKAKLLSGQTADAVILSREGLSQLVALGKILPGSDTDLAEVPLGLAVSAGTPKPNIATVDAFKDAVLEAKKIAFPGSTSGIYLNTELLPRLGIKDQLEIQMTERGSQSTSLLAAKKVNMAIQPSSELVNVPGIDYVGPIPKEIQLVQIFAAAITSDAQHPEAARKLINYLSSPKANEAIKQGGLNLIR